MSELLNFILDHESAFKSRARLTSLYSDFAVLKSSNPDGYAANVLAWRSALEHASRAGMTPAPSAPYSSDGSASCIVLQTGEQLLKQLETSELGQPLALADVVDNAADHGHIIPLRLFLESKLPLTTSKKRRKSWIPSLTVPTPYDVVRWLVAQTGLFASASTKLAQGQFVVLKTLEEASQAVLHRVAEQSSTSSSLVHSLRTFQDAFEDVLPQAPRLSHVDNMALLTYLSRDKSLISLSRPVQDTAASADDHLEPLVIKFTAAASGAALTPITQQDRTIASLKTLSLSLSTQVKVLGGRLADLEHTLRNVIPKTSTSSLQKTRALSMLRQKKAIESTLQRRLDSQTQIEQTLTRIDDAATNVEMTRAMEASAGVLEDLNKQVGGAEGVARVMDRLADARADSEEIGHGLQQDAAAEMDDGAVEEELEQMVRESRSEQRDKERTEVEESEASPRGEAAGEAGPALEHQLPTAPTTEPGEQSRASAKAPGSSLDAEGGLKDSFGHLSLTSPSPSRGTDAAGAQRQASGEEGRLPNHTRAEVVDQVEGA